MAEAKELWNELRSVLDSCATLAEASSVIVYGHSHPHAISGAELQRLAGEPAGPGATQPDVNVAALLEAWSERVSGLQAPLASLARSG